MNMDARTVTAHRLFHTPSLSHRLHAWSMVCAWALVLDQVTAEVEGALSSALESDDGQALIDACDLAKAYGLESTAARFEEAKERVEQKSREVGDDDHAC